MSDNPYKTPEAAAVPSDVGGADPKLERSITMLRQTKPWVRLISVVLFLGTFMMSVGGLFILVGGLAGAGGLSGTLGVTLGSFYFVASMIYIAPAIFLWKYANRIGIFVSEGTTGALASALQAQKSFWKFVGICMLVVITIYAAIFVFSIIGVFIARGAL